MWHWSSEDTLELDERITPPGAALELLLTRCYRQTFLIVIWSQTGQILWWVPPGEA